MTLKQFFKDLGISAFFLIVATMVSYFFFVNAESSSNVATCYMLAVFFISRYTFGHLWGFLSSVIGVIIINYIFAFPYFAIDFFRKGYPLTFIGMLTISLITSAVTTQINRQKQEAIQNEIFLTTLNQFNKHVLGCKSKQELLSLTVSYLAKLDESSVLFWPSDNDNNIQMYPCHLYNDDTMELFQHERIRNQALKLKTSSKNGIIETKDYRYYYLPIRSMTHNWGTIFICSKKETLPKTNMQFHELMIPQIALSLEHFSLLEHSHTLMLESEKEKMRSNLLRAVSHDLRTPLTGMIGASSAYLDAKDYLSEDYKDELIQGIHSDANWLLNMVENLLSVTRIDQTQKDATVKKQPEPLEEVVSEALVRFQKRYPNVLVDVTIPEEFLMLPMDATLIEQVIINLLENATVHGKGTKPINFYVEKKDTSVVFHIRDYGKGISKKHIPFIFDGYPITEHKHNDTHKGMGIGLSICKSIILAHQGKIEAKSYEDGAEFLFHLPF